MTKTILVLPVALALLAGCASSSGTQPQSPQANVDCSTLSGAALVECQKEVQPTSSTGSTFKMVKPKPVNGKSGGVGAGGHNASAN